jgi:hypothetical protein
LGIEAFKFCDAEGRNCKMSGSGLFVKNPKSNTGILKKRDILLSSYLNENEPMTEAGKHLPAHAGKRQLMTPGGRFMA